MHNGHKYILMNMVRYVVEVVLEVKKIIFSRPKQMFIFYPLLKLAVIVTGVKQLLFIDRYCLTA